MPRLTSTYVKSLKISLPFRSSPGGNRGSIIFQKQIICFNQQVGRLSMQSVKINIHFTQQAHIVTSRTQNLWCFEYNAKLNINVTNPWKLQTYFQKVKKYSMVLQQNHLIYIISNYIFWEALEGVWQEHGSALTEWLGDSGEGCLLSELCSLCYRLVCSILRRTACPWVLNKN